MRWLYNTYNMPSPEHFYQSRSLEAPQISHADRREQPTTSPRMEHVVTRLATAHGVDLSQPGAALSVEMSDRAERWLFTNLDGQRLSVTHCNVEEGNLLALDLDMVYVIQPDGLAPVELLHADSVWKAYAQAIQAQGKPAADGYGNFCYADFSDFQAHLIEQQGWLEQARKVEDPVV